MMIGQVYAQVDEPRRAWQVVRVITPFDSIPHASLECLTDRKTTKFLSCQILQDRRSFVQLADEENLAVQTLN